MAVYTEVPEDEVRALVARLGLGALIHFEGIRGGIENTNYFVDTTARALRADAVRAADGRASCPTTCG